MNAVFAGFILLAIGAAFGAALLGNSESLFLTSQAMFSAANLAVEVSLGLVGVLTLWSGLFLLAERSHLAAAVARGAAPVLQSLMPALRQHPQALAPVTMNLSANVLGLDNAATPLGLKAMQAMQQLNPQPKVASDPQIMFLVLNTSSVTLIPITVFMFRAQQGAANPTDIYLPLLLATTVSTFVGVWVTARMQRISLMTRPVLLLAAGWLAVLALLSTLNFWLPEQQAMAFSGLLGSGILLLVVALFLAVALYRGVPVYDTFIEGARKGFGTAVRIIPYLVAMLVAIAMLRASGLLDMLLDSIRYLVLLLGMDSRFVDALPVAFLKPLSGSGARAMMIEVMQTHGVDSLAGRMAAIMQGSTETTFYVLAVYFGSVNVVRMRYAVAVGLLSDVAGLSAAILVSYWFFA